MDSCTLESELHALECVPATIASRCGRRLFGLVAAPAIAILMWSRADVIGLFSNNVVSFSRNVVLSGLSFSLNVV